MTRIAGASLLLAALTAAAGCGVGGDDGGGTTPPGDDQPGPVDNAEVCSASFAITGTFARDNATPPPTDPETGTPLTGCWPIGAWTFTASVASNMCSAAPAVLASYSFTVKRTAAPDGGNDTVQTIENTTPNMGSLKYHLAMSSNGQGCEGHFEFGSADGTQYWNMTPTLPKDLTATAITGGGDYVLYKKDAWPWPQ
jgi:hypothetical protein